MDLGFRVFLGLTVKGLFGPGLRGLVHSLVVYTRILQLSPATEARRLLHYQGRFLEGFITMSGYG